MDAKASEWDLDSDEIASVASDELHNNRPNRWTGPRSTWRTLTQEERHLWQSLKQLRDQDLSIHLYNAFALKKRGKDPKTAQELLVRTHDGQDAIWAPPKLWTAWPLKERHLPPEGLMQKKEAEDEDESFTYRRKEQNMPSTELEDELTAIILGQAKNRFLKRRRKAAPPLPPLPSIEAATPSRGGEDQEEEEDEDNDASSQQLPALHLSAPTSSPPQASEEELSVDEEASERGKSGEPERPAARDYEPVVSANDDLSHRILQPSVRHILSQLDKTLTVLHNSRVAGLGYLSDSTTEDESDAGTPRKKRAMGRPRAAWRHGGTPSSPDSQYATTPPTGSRRGRPRKMHIPLEGESHDDMLHRVARESHRRLPVLAKERDAAFEEWILQGEREVASREAAASSPLPRTATPQSAGDGGFEMTDEGDEPGTLNVEKKLARWGLRDWGDVVGAAALAGFPRDVIARTTRRCADLFGEGMVMRHLDEVPAARGTGVHSVDYKPEPARLWSAGHDNQGDDDDSSHDSMADDDVGRTLRQRRIASRRSSLARSSQGSDSASISARGGRSRSHSLSQSRSRSRSRSSVAQFYCPVPSCHRAASPFARRANLARHMQLIHRGSGGGGDDSRNIGMSVSGSVGPVDTDNEGDGDDEDDDFAGGVHVDGFLKPIIPGRGWRGDDLVVRKRKSRYGERTRFAPHSSPSRRRRHRRSRSSSGSGASADEEGGDSSS